MSVKGYYWHQTPETPPHLPVNQVSTHIVQATHSDFGEDYLFCEKKIWHHPTASSNEKNKRNEMTPMGV